MIKLRGVNVFPEAVGAVVAQDKRGNGEFFCIVERVGKAGRDEMTVMVEITDANCDRTVVKAELEQRMREVLGVKVIVMPVEPGATDLYTGMSQTSKIKRLADNRKSS